MQISFLLWQRVSTSCLGNRRVSAARGRFPALLLSVPVCRIKRDLAVAAAALVFRCPIPPRISTHLYSSGSEDELQASSPTNLHLGEQNSSIFHAEGKEEYVYVHIYLDKGKVSAVKKSR